MAKSIFKRLILTAALGMAFGAAPAMAGYEKTSLRYEVREPRKIALQYDVYAGGFKALNATMGLDLDPKAYDLSLDASTQGMIGSLFPWKASYVTSGHAGKDGAPVPTMYIERSTWKEKVKLTEMNYDPDGNLLKSTVQEGDRTTVKRDFEAKFSADAVDLLTGALMMMQQTRNTQSCAGSFPVFDGKRRYNINLTDAGSDTLKKSTISKFSGEALRCTVKVEPVAGFKKKDQKKGWLAVQNHTEERKKPPTIWFAPLEENGPVVPVRMEIASAYGTVVAHLTQTTAK